VAFKPGQKVVYPNHGIAIIEQIETRQINGEQHEFYLLRVRENNSLVMVPMRNVAEVRLRKPIAGKECEALLQLLARDFDAPPTDWKDRFKEFSDKMRSGDLFAVAEVLKTLTWLNQLKPLSFREKRMLERARYLVISELACVCRLSEAKVEAKVDEALRGACNSHAQTFTRTASTRNH
jgi:CarD family transcriptional regulator